MPRSIVAVFVALFAYICLIAVAIGFPPAEAQAEDLNYGDRPGATFVSCSEAQTCVFNLPSADPLLGWKIPVTVRGLDAPSIRGACQEENEQALKARDVARRFLESAEVIVLRNATRGDAFNIVADVEVNGQDLGALLINSGMAFRRQKDEPRHNYCPKEPAPTNVETPSKP